MVRVIQIGMGGFGGRWLEAVAATPGVTFVGLVEISEAIIAEQTERHGLAGIPVFRTLPDALAAIGRDQVDGIIDCTPPMFHRANATIALEAGIPVLVEKPLSDRLDDAEAIVRLADQTGVTLMVGQSYRYTAPARTVRALLAGGAIGALDSIHATHYKGLHVATFRQTMRYPLIQDMVIHHLDMLRFFTGAEPARLQARSWRPAHSWVPGDMCLSLWLEMTSGVRFSYEASWVAQGRGSTWNGDWRFDGSDGVIALTEDRVNVYAPLPEGRETAGAPGTPGTEVAPDADPRTYQEALLDRFVASITDGTPPETRCQDNIRSLRLVFDIIRAVETGETLTLT